ncbi:MFS transporter [Roseomonas elaeocarpi]|uniref:MFS transporter n=1 Tax=Roseomonas elaeocarpi TaxID=907779 RepID=A0ABV6JYY4_9PROT
MSIDARRSLLVALLVAGTFFMENLDGTVIATALPQMAQSFGVAAVDLNIGMSAYLLTLAVLIPGSGWLADRYGARNVFTLAIAIFTLASALCALADGLWSFTAARVFQGIGGAMMVPVGRLAVLRNTEKKDLVRRIATITWPGLAAPVLGPPLGGFITTYADWRWIFILNLPLGLVALVMAWRLVPGGGTERRPFDAPGFLLTGLAAFSLMYGLELVGQGEGALGLGALLLLLSFGVGLVAVWHARRTERPMLDFSALRIQTFRVTLAGGSVTRAAISATPFLLPLLFQLGFGLDAFNAGLLVLAVFAGNILMKPVSMPILRGFGFRTVLLGSATVAACCYFACAFFTPATPVPVMVVVLFVSGLARSMVFTVLNTLAFAEVPPAQMSGANSLFSMLQQMAVGVGIALGAIVLRLGQMIHGHDQPMLSDFRLAFLFTALLTLAGLVDGFGLRRDAAAAVSGHRAGAA